jgi:hypothetical protein
MVAFERVCKWSLQGLGAKLLFFVPLIFICIFFAGSLQTSEVILTDAAV